MKIWIEVSNNALPLNHALANHIKQRLHIGCKLSIYNDWEGFHHNVVYDLTKLRHIQIFLFLCDVVTCKNSSNCRCISRRTSYSLFLKHTNKCCLCKVSRRLCKMLLRLFFTHGKLHALTKMINSRCACHFFFTVIINTHKAVK